MRPEELIRYVGMGIEIEYFDSSFMTSALTFSGVLIAQRAERNFATAWIKSTGVLDYSPSFLSKDVVSVNSKLYHNYGTITDKVISWNWTCNKNCITWDEDKQQSFGFVATCQPKNENPDRCLVCGSKGKNMVFSFYCVNPSCQNYRES